ncbi:MAG: EAL domain-containing protein [Solirubrobacteraceae bacterium]
MLRLPWVRIIGSRWQEPVFVAWSVASVGVVIFGTVLEGGPRSPVIVLLFLQLVWMGLAYPGRLVLALSTVDVLAFLALEVVYRRPAPEAAVYALGLVIASSLTFWQTRNRAHWGRVLRESERRLSLAQAIARIGSWEWQAGSDELVMSTELLRIIGVESPAPASTLDAYLSRVHPADREIVEAAVRRAGRTGERFAREHRIVRPDGAVMSVELHGEADGAAGSERKVRAVCQDVSELRAVEARLAHEAAHDGLTGLVNRRRLVDEIERQLGDGRGPELPGAVMLIDVDGFGYYNDSYGQPAGDALLRSLARALLGRLRASDLVARSGGDEFAVLLADAGLEAAVVIAGQLRELLSECAPGAPITLSFGVATLEHDQQHGADVLAAADIALHEAKRAGGNRVETYTGAPGADMTWVQRIRDALAEDRFVLYAQPIIDNRSGAVSHRELLIRMLDQDGQPIPPGDFLPAAERFGLINLIDRWVTAAAIRLAFEGDRVAVNLSAHSIGDTNLLSAVDDAVHSGLDPSNLMFEITETAAASNLADARAFAAQLTATGCELAIDDFGTGFASLTYLKHLPARYVKIDIEFIRELTRNETDRHLVAAIVAIARSLGKQTVAEGVEDQATLDAVRALGVDYAQGFFTGRPAPLYAIAQPDSLQQAA